MIEAIKAKAIALWEKIKKWCRDSLTLAWGYVLAGLGILGTVIDQLGVAFGDPDLKSQITDLFDRLGISAKALAIIGIVTILARLRSLIGK